MWILFVLVVTMQGIDTHEVDRYATKDACDIKKASLELEFVAAYPGDQDWAFVCLLPRKEKTA